MECIERNLVTCVSTVYASESVHAYFDHLSVQTYSKHSVEAKVFGLSIVVARTPVITSYKRARG